MRRRIGISVCTAACLLAGAADAAAQSGFNFGPDNGSQIARGSAWVARADDATAVFYNPAGLSRQRRNIFYGGHLMTMNRCFTRTDAFGNPVSPGQGLPAPGTPGGPPAAVCMSKSPVLNVQIGAVWHVGDRISRS